MSAAQLLEVSVRLIVRDELRAAREDLTQRRSKIRLLVDSLIQRLCRALRVGDSKLQEHHGSDQGWYQFLKSFGLVGIYDFEQISQHEPGSKSVGRHLGEQTGDLLAPSDRSSHVNSSPSLGSDSSSVGDGRRPNTGRSGAGHAESPTS